MNNKNSELIGIVERTMTHGQTLRQNVPENSEHKRSTVDLQPEIHTLQDP